MAVGGVWVVEVRHGRPMRKLGRNYLSRQGAKGSEVGDLTVSPTNWVQGPLIGGVGDRLLDGAAAEIGPCGDVLDLFHPGEISARHVEQHARAELAKRLRQPAAEYTRRIERRTDDGPRLRVRPEIGLGKPLESPLEA